jgi:alpha-tubulin suppressor-like RCC1 family protein
LAPNQRMKLTAGGRRVRHKRAVGPLLAVAVAVGCSNNPSSPGPGKSLIASVSILLDSVTTVPGAELYGLGTRVFDTLGHPQPSYRLTWTSSDPAKATVDSFGLVRILATGSVNIEAAAGGHADTLRIRVVSFDFTSVATGVDHTCGITSQHVAACWGNNDQVGRIGLPDSALIVSGPVAVQSVPALSSVTAGSDHSCGLTAAGAAYCWGANDRGQLGIGDVDTRPHLATPVVGGLTFASLAAGYANTCGLTTTGTAYCWGADEMGRNGHGGDGSAADDSFPVPVSGGLTFQTLAVGLLNGCGITTDSTAYCWGDAGQGEIGAFPLPGFCGSHNGNPYCAAPVPVAGGNKFVAIASGMEDACGVAAGGAVYCWGSNSSGSTGDTLSRDSLPFAVGGGFAFVSIATTSTHICGITANGQAYCWGVGTSGELGSGATASNRLPQAVSGGLTFASISAGFSTCGVTTSGVAYCWGPNQNGVLGVGGFPSPIVMETTPTRVVGQP